MSLQNGLAPLTYAVINDNAIAAKYWVNVANADCSKVAQVTFVKIVLVTKMLCKFITLNVTGSTKINIIVHFKLIFAYMPELWKLSYIPARKLPDKFPLQGEKVKREGGQKN